ncbi:MAG: hypothetical protein AB7I27_13660 [Bacteriovoracaceae bacterium]
MKTFIITFLLFTTTAFAQYEMAQLSIDCAVAREGEIQVCGTKFYRFTLEIMGTKYQTINDQLSCDFGKYEIFIKNSREDKYGAFVKLTKKSIFFDVKKDEIYAEFDLLTLNKTYVIRDGRDANEVECQIRFE